MNDADLIRTVLKTWDDSQVAAVAAVDRLEASAGGGEDLRIDAVIALHRLRTKTQTCIVDREPWPCRTRRLLLGQEGTG